MEGDKPKKRRLSGMKKNPYAKKKKQKRTYKAKVYKGRIIMGVNQTQRERLNEFLKVREGETLEQWKKRTTMNRVSDVDEAEELRLTKKLLVYHHKKDKAKYEQDNKYIRVQKIPIYFDFMRYYGVVVNYFSVKYGVRIEDYQMGFYFYSNIPFTRERFEHDAVLHFGTKRGKMSHFISNGYLEEIIKRVKRYKEEDEYERTSLYRLTSTFTRKLTEIYGVLGKMNTIRTDQHPFINLSPEIQQILTDLNDEITDIQTGRKPQSS